MRTLKIAIIGAGNVAAHLTPALSEKGHDICCVYSRTRFSAKALADTIGCRFTTKIEDLDTDADIYIISVSDKVRDLCRATLVFQITGHQYIHIIPFICTGVSITVS